MRTLITLLAGVSLAVTLLAGCKPSSVASGATSTASTSTAGSSSASASGLTSSASSSGSAGSSAASATPTVSPTASPTPSPSGAPVHVSLLEADGSTYGVGMPIIAYFSKAPTNAAAFQAATKVTVNGTPVSGGWYFEGSSQKGYALEAHWRPENYWPGHAQIHLDLPVQGLSAGPGLVFDDSLTLNMNTGAANISTVNAKTLQMTVTSDGQTVNTFPVSLGEASNPTFQGTKVIMEKDREERMIGPGYDLLVAYSLRITYSGEFVHAAPWNSLIGKQSTSHGCTNLTTTDAAWMFNFSQIGDVVQYPNAPGKTVPVADGYGDWNVPWSTWLQGGQVTTV